MAENTELAEHVQTDEINLKHRVTGAAVLIFFGALVLPWLLGPPSEARKSEQGLANSVMQEEAGEPSLEDEVLQRLEGLDGLVDEPEETVYISKITPVDAIRGSNQKQPKPQLQTTKSAASQSTPDKSNSKPKQAASAAKRQNQKPVSTTDGANKSNTSSKGDSAKLAKASAGKNASGKSQADAKTKKLSPKAVASKTGKPAVSKPAPSKKVVKPTAERKVDVGWVVQVELLTDKDGAQRLVGQLKGQGFKPKTTIVDTNRGKKTGTRIWLGPFEQRAEAGKENLRLEQRTGKSGFIRVYP